MDIPLWCDKSRTAKVLPIVKGLGVTSGHVLKVTTPENNTVSDTFSPVDVKTIDTHVSKNLHEEPDIDIHTLCQQPIFQDILLYLKATSSDVTALPSTEHKQNIKIKHLSWQFSSDLRVVLRNTQLHSPSLALIAKSPILKRVLWQQLSLINLSDS